MKHQASTYKQGRVRKILDSVLAAITGKPEVNFAGITTESEVKAARALYKAKQAKPTVRARKGTERPVSIGTYGVSSLEDILKLVEDHKTHESRMAVTHLNSRQAVQQAIKDSTERISRDVLSDGTRIPRHTQAAISQILAQPDPLVTFGRFVLHLQAFQDRPLLAPVISKVLGIPIDKLAKN